MLLINAYYRTVEWRESASGQIIVTVDFYCVMVDLLTHYNDYYGANDHVGMNL